MSTLSTPSRPEAELVCELVVDVVRGVVATVAGDMRGHQASLVYQVLRETVTRRLPGIPVDDEQLRAAAARIAVGLAPV